MKHLIVVAHPSEGSFTMGLARAYAAELETLGNRQQTYDTENPVSPLQDAHICA